MDMLKTSWARYLQSLARVGQGIREVVGETGSKQACVRENRVSGYKVWCVMTNEYFQVLPRHARASTCVSITYSRRRLGLDKE